MKGETPVDIRTIFQQNPIIAAADQENLSLAMHSKACAVLLMYAKLNDLLDKVTGDKLEQKPLFLHTDLMKGLSNDKEAFRFLARYVKPAGIVTTKSPMIRAAKKEGLLTIQRIFLIDTASFHTAIQNVRENEPDAIEIMPGIAPSIIQAFREYTQRPIILGGLIRSFSQVQDALDSGANAVSLSKSNIWNMQI